MAHFAVKIAYIICLHIFLYIFTEIQGEVIKANVTKIIHVKNANVTTNQTVSLQSASTNRSESQGEFFTPNTISVSAGGNNDETRYTILPLPPSFRLPGHGLEETFTYSVRKQQRPASDLIGIHEEFNLLQERAKRESFEAIQYYVNELNKEMSNKINNLSTSITQLSTGMIGNISAVTSAWDQLNQDVLNLTKLSKETSRLVKVLHFTHEQVKNENTVLNEHVSNLSSQVASLKLERSGDLSRILSTLASLQTRLYNATHEIRVHEAHLRYGQQVMTAIRESVDQNIDRITGLEKDGDPQWTEQTVGCGGVLVANSGIISYKFRQPYLNNERCVWIIRVNRKSKINLQLLEDGFQNESNSDFLTVTEFAEDQHPVTLITSSRLEHGNSALHTFQGPVIFVTFYSDKTSPGTGFTLTFIGVGNRTSASSVNAIRHFNRHFSEPAGLFTYPNENTKTYQPNELVTLAINPMNASSLKISMKHTDLEKDEFCEFDSISFYGSVTASYALTKRYCQQAENFTGEMIQSSDGIFLVIFRSDASTQFSGFQFSWEIE